jgi:pimeloyl-ACP methyl ester carboxylesterase
MLIEFLFAAMMLAAPAQGTRESFVAVNGVRLHYVDWGGRGPTLLFLIGGGNGSAHTFDSFAPRFSDRFRVLGLTRRGQGPSDKPSSGYDTRTLVEDIRAFIDAMGIERVILIGHSIAGAEMTRFAGLYPNRVSKLVYLDSALDYARLDEIAQEARFSGSAPDTPLGQIERGAAAAHPDFSKVDAPALAFVVVYDELPPSDPKDDPAYRRDIELLYQKGFWWEISRRFESEMRKGRVVTLHHTNHNFFKDPTQVDRVVREIHEFLASR